MIKALFFDIDGTLVPYGEPTIPPHIIEALNKLREKGIKLFISTGRPANSLDHITRVFSFDGYITANGQYCFTNDEIVKELYIPKSSIETIIPYINEKKVPVLFAAKDISYRNKYNTFEYDSKWPLVNLEEIKDIPLIQIMAFIDETQDREFLAHLPGCKAQRWTSTFADIVTNEGGKDKGIESFLNYYSYSLDEIIVFGDGGNDIPMLDYAIHSVAMGNASDEVKSHASYVTDTDINDGLIKAFEHFQLI